MNDNLERLAQEYSESRADSKTLGEAVRELYLQCVDERESSILEAASAAAGMGALVSDRIDLDQVTPQMQEAWNLAYPSVPLESLTERSTAEISGFLSGWKGKYFEVLVRDELNAGGWVGDLHLAPGQYAELAEDVGQPGWDLVIRSADGGMAEQVQLKATTDLSYIREALERYPDMEIIAPDEAVGTLEHVFGSGISEDDLIDHILEPMESLLDSPLEDAMESVLPFLPFIVITGSEGRHLLIGRKSFEQAMSGVAVRAVKSGLAMAAGTAVIMLEGGFLALPAAFMVRLGVDRVQVGARIRRRIDEEISRTRVLVPAYCPTPL